MKNKIKNDPNIDLTELKHHIYKIVLSHFKQPKLCKFLLNSDFIDIYIIVFYDCIKAFKDDKNTDFSTYFYKSIINAARKILKNKYETPISQLSKDDETAIYNTLFYSPVDNVKLELDSILKKANLNQKQKQMLELYYFNHMSYSQIAKILDTTRQNVNQKMQTIMKRLKGVANVETESVI